MGTYDKLYWMGAIVVAFALGMAFGGILVSIDSDDFSYQEASVMTCLYANNLTEIINIQSETLHLYSNTNYTKLEMLNCNKLK
jgi:uncharacterized membrane-anchored protein